MTPAAGLETTQHLRFATDSPVVGAFGRTVVAGFVLVLAAIVVTMSGGAGLGGRLGSLFGLHSKPAQAQPQAVVETPLTAPFGGHVSATRTAPRNAGRTRPPATHRKRTAPVRSVPRRSPPPPPAPAPAVPAPPPAVPPPAPSPSGTVGQALEVVKQATAPVAPAQPLVDQVTQTVGQVCGLLGGCP